MIVPVLIALATCPIAWGLSIWLTYSVDYIKYDLGKYTRAYRCTNCNQIHRLQQDICDKCGYEFTHGKLMCREVGKWNCKISKLTLTYWWEPKEDN